MTVISKIKQTMATLKNVQETLDIYATQTEDKEIKIIFKDAVETAGVIIQDIENRIKKLEFEEPQYKGY